jgi:hypothetical protein
MENPVLIRDFMTNRNLFGKQGSAVHGQGRKAIAIPDGYSRVFPARGNTHA